MAKVKAKTKKKTAKVKETIEVEGGAKVLKQNKAAYALMDKAIASIRSFLPGYTFVFGCVNDGGVGCTQIEGRALPQLDIIGKLGDVVEKAVLEQLNDSFKSRAEK